MNAHSTCGVHTRHTESRTEGILLLTRACLPPTVGWKLMWKAKVVQIPQILLKAFCIHSSVPRDVCLGVILIWADTNTICTCHQFGFLIGHNSAVIKRNVVQPIELSAHNHWTTDLYVKPVTWLKNLHKDAWSGVFPTWKPKGLVYMHLHSIFIESGRFNMSRCSWFECCFSLMQRARHRTSDRKWTMT